MMKMTSCSILCRLWEEYRRGQVMIENKDQLDHQSVWSASGFHAKVTYTCCFLIVIRCCVGDGEPGRSCSRSKYMTVGGAREAGVRFIELNIIWNINYKITAAIIVTDFWFDFHRVKTVSVSAWRWTYRGVDKSLARPTSRSILFVGENISFYASLVVYINSTNIHPIMIINRIYETQNLLSL